MTGNGFGIVQVGDKIKIRFFGIMLWVFEHDKGVSDPFEHHRNAVNPILFNVFAKGL